MTGFVPQAIVIADGNMFSLVFSRRLPLWPTPETLGNQFEQWIQSV
jgi:hypothetical protein